MVAVVATETILEDLVADLRDDKWEVVASPETLGCRGSAN